LQGQGRQDRQENVESSGKETWEETGEESSFESSMLSKDGTTRSCERQGIFWGKSGASEIEVAIKVFKTSILVFKDREKYVAGVWSRQTQPLPPPSSPSLALSSLASIHEIMPFFFLLSGVSSEKLYFAADSTLTLILSEKKDYRFRHGYSKKPQKMVQMWAEKEFRNLKRIFQAGIR
jgi:hypothetical protein